VHIAKPGLVQQVAQLADTRPVVDDRRAPDEALAIVLGVVLDVQARRASYWQST
jgi:hypothetical protein